ncbi:hypothetical protein QEN19_000981 [Hanseniaspora menglaensis]
MGKLAISSTNEDEQKISIEKVRKEILNLLYLHENNMENKKVVIEQLQKTIEHNKIMNNQEMINKLKQLQECILNEKLSTSDTSISELLNSIFKLENLTDKNGKLIEDQVLNMDNDDEKLTYEDLYNLMKVNDIL